MRHKVDLIALGVAEAKSSTSLLRNPRDLSGMRIRLSVNVPVRVRTCMSKLGELMTLNAKILHGKA